MINKKNTLSVMIGTILCATLLPLAGCNKKTPDQPPSTNAASAPAQTAYVPPTSDQLYQMVGPIALFPDKLVAQVLAGSTYPDQITAADNWIQQNKSLTPAQMQSTVSQQPWDVSVKGLAMFPNVLDQMAQNIQWTTALGTAYVNDPTDVMNAIQVMRQRASTSGNLKASKQQKITITPRIHRAPDQGYDVQQGEPVVYSGPDVISPPDQTIVIEPADPDVVYVPNYNPRVAYGEPMQYYPGYQDYEPQQGYSTGEIVTAGALTFGVGVAIVALNHHDGGWNSWGVHWGGHRHDQDYGRNNGDSNGGWHRPAVEYNNSTYVSRSTTITNNNTYYNNSNNRNTTNNEARPAGNNGAPPNGGHDHQGNNLQRPNFSPQQQPNQSANTPFGERPHTAPTGQPNFNNMQEPHFNQHEGAVNTGAAASNANNFNRPHGEQSTVKASVAETPPASPNFNNMQRPNFNQHEGVAAAGAAALNPNHFDQHHGIEQSAAAHPSAPNFNNNTATPSFGHHELNGNATEQHQHMNPNGAESAHFGQPPQEQAHPQPQQIQQHQWQQPQVHTQPAEQPHPQIQQPAQHQWGQPQAHPQPQMQPPAQHQWPQPQQHTAPQQAQPQPQMQAPAQHQWSQPQQHTPPQQAQPQPPKPAQAHGFGEHPNPDKKEDPNHE